jgi:hypothetical protein
MSLLFRGWFLKSIAMLNNVVSSLNYSKAKQESPVGDLPSSVLPYIPLTHVAISVLMNVDGDKHMLTLTDIKCFGLICIDQEGAGKECNKSQNVGSLEPSLTPSMKLNIATLHQLNMIIN